MIPDRMWEMWATLLIFSLGVVPLLCHFTHISLTLLSLGKMVIYCVLEGLILFGSIPV